MTRRPSLRSPRRRVSRFRAGSIKCHQGDSSPMAMAVRLQRWRRMSYSRVKIEKNVGIPLQVSGVA